MFCAFDQIHPLKEIAKKHGFKTYNHPFVFIKNYSAEVLKANMRPVGACEYGVLFYRDKLPKFNNHGEMVYNWMPFDKDFKEKIHPTQKPISLLKKLIELFTDEGDTVIDPVAGSGSTLLAAKLLGRNSYGFEIKKNFYQDAIKNINETVTIKRGKVTMTQTDIFDFMGD
jgi:site-specific DNA-methyltransferase (adenine-specific)